MLYFKLLLRANNALVYTLQNKKYDNYTYIVSGPQNIYSHEQRK